MNTVPWTGGSVLRDILPFFFFFLKDSSCLRLGSCISQLPDYRIFRLRKPSFILSSLCPLQSHMVVFSLMEHCKTLCGSPIRVWEIHFIRQKFLHTSILEKHISIPDLYWDGWWDSSFIHLISPGIPPCDWTFWFLGPWEVLAECCPAMSLAFSPEQLFWPWIS